MTLIEMKNLVERWFGVAECAGLVIPNGWFGRPYDSFDALKEIVVNNDTLSIHLDGGKILIFIHLRRIYVNKSELVFEGFAQLIFKWQEIGGDEVHEEQYASGEVRFVPPIGTKLA